MIINDEDEKFFENLVGTKAEADNEYDDTSDAHSGEAEIELAKAATAPAALRPKMIRTREEKEDLWDDGEPEGQLTVDVYQTPNDIVVESAIAGVAPDDIDVNVTTDSIAIRGARKREKTVRDEDYLYQECYWGKFGRSIILPQEVDPEGAVVKFKNGILTVTLPKANRKKVHKLKVRID
ncbi:MAG: Hsp20/alpha crystallin family protein [Minisyncoccia bacterium]|jgi:HSP20 family protein